MTFFTILLKSVHKAMNDARNICLKKSGQSVTSSLQFVTWLTKVNLSRRNWIGSHSILESVVIAKVLSKIHIPTDKIFMGTYHLEEPFYEFEEIISTCNHQKLWGFSLSVLSLSHMQTHTCRYNLCLSLPNITMAS